MCILKLLLQIRTYESQLSIFYSCQPLSNHRNHNKNIHNLLLYSISRNTCRYSGFFSMLPSCNSVMLLSIQQDIIDGRKSEEIFKSDMEFYGIILNINFKHLCSGQQMFTTCRHLEFLEISLHNHLKVMLAKYMFIIMKL